MLTLMYNPVKMNPENSENSKDLELACSMPYRRKEYLPEVSRFQFKLELVRQTVVLFCDHLYDKNELC